MITQKLLKETLHYTPDTGTFVWKVSTGPASPGKVAGHCTNKGYIYIRIDGKYYSAGRLVWLYVYGHFPENQIDHINRVRNDNRLANLREVSQSCNTRNSGMLSTNTSGVKGVWLDTTGNKWVAEIIHNGQKYRLGRSMCKIEAAALRYTAEQCLDWPDCDTKSSAGDYIRYSINSTRED